MSNEKPSLILNCNFSDCSYALESLGVDLNDVFQLFSLNYAKYEKEPYIFNRKQMEAIVEFLYHQINLPDLGLIIGKRIRYGFQVNDDITFGTYLSAREFLWALSRYLSDLFPSLVLEYYEHYDVVGYKLVRCPYMQPHQQFYIEALAAMIHNFLRFLLGNDTQPEYIAFNYQKPYSFNNYREYFDCDLRFNQNQFEIAINRKIADSPIILTRQDTGISPHLSVGSLFPLHLYSLSRQIHTIMEKTLDKTPSEMKVASSLQISARTLRRKLSLFNSNFQKELDFFRRDLAFRYLLSQDYDITNIAFTLGYCDSSAFSKAFRKWAGVSPREFRKQYCAIKSR